MRSPGLTRRAAARFINISAPRTTPRGARKLTAAPASTRRLPGASSGAKYGRSTLDRGTLDHTEPRGSAPREHLFCCW